MKIEPQISKERQKNKALQKERPKQVHKKTHDRDAASRRQRAIKVAAGKQKLQKETMN